MTYADVIGQMQRIQAHVALFTPQRATASTGVSGSGAAFTTALARAAARTDAAPSAAASTTVAATTAVDGTTIDANGVTGDDVVQAALQYKGVPYVLGGESKSGIDCSALVQSAFKDLGVDVPRLVHEQQTVGQQVDSLKDAKPGDLIVLNGGDHIAIYMGDDTVIHAPYAGRTVSVQKAWFTDADITSIRRVVPATGDGTTAASTATSADSSSTTSSGLSAATVARATALLAMFGGSGASGDSTSSDQSLSSLLSSFGITGTSGSTSATGTAAAAAGFLGTAGTTGATTSSSTTQQLIAARAAMYGTSS